MTHPAQRPGVNDPGAEAPRRASAPSARRRPPRAPAKPPVELVSVTNMKRAAAVVLALLLLPNAHRPEALGPVMTLTFFIHEAGHLIFSMFPQFVYIAAGSAFQCALPLAAIGVAWRRRTPFLASLAGFWLAYNLFYVAQYAKDAVDMVLPGMRGDIHDWNYMLDVLGLFGATQAIAGAILTLGVLVVLASLGVAVLFADEEI